VKVCLAKYRLKSAVGDYGVYAEDDFALGSTSYTAGDEITLESGFRILYRASASQITGWEGADSPYLTDQFNTGNSHDYTINRADMTLKLGGAVVAFGTEISNGVTH